MIKRLEKSSWIAKLMLLMIIAFVFTVLLSMATIYLKIDNGNTTNLRWFMLAQNMLIFILPAILLSYLISSSPISDLKLNHSPGLLSIIGVIIVLILSIPMMNYIVSWNESITFPIEMKNIESLMRKSEDAAQAITNNLIMADNIWAVIANVLIIGIMAGVGEELMFRGTIQRIFISKPMNAHVAIWCTAFIFSSLHFQFFGFIPRMLLGAFFGYLVWWTGSLWLPIITHALNNSLVVILGYVFKSEVQDIFINKIGNYNSDTAWVALMSMCAVILFIVFFRKKFFKITNINSNNYETAINI